MYTQWVFSVIRVPTWFLPGVGVVDCGPLSTASAILSAQMCLQESVAKEPLHSVDIPLEKEEPSLEIPATPPRHL